MVQYRRHTSLNFLKTLKVEKGFLGIPPKQAGAIAEGKLHGKNDGAKLMQSVCDRVLTGNLRTCLNRTTLFYLNTTSCYCTPTTS